MTDLHAAVSMYIVLAIPSQNKILDVQVLEPKHLDVFAHIPA